MIVIYSISLDRFPARRDHIAKEVSTKSRLPCKAIGIDALIERKQPGWASHASSLRDSEIGCALSHASACRSLVQDGADFGLIVEDDVVLPENLDEILHELTQEMSPGDVIALYSRSIKRANFSTLGKKEIDGRDLVFPMETRLIRTAAAYVIGKEAARRIAAYNDPVKVVADNWTAFFQAGCIRTIRLLYPLCVNLQPFESTLSTDRGGSLVRRVKTVAAKFPPAVRAREVRRVWIERRREQNVSFMDLPADQMAMQKFWPHGE